MQRSGVLSTSEGTPLEGTGIAAAAARPRNDGEVFHDLRFPAILDLIPPGDLLVLNSTRVRHARLLGKRPSGAAAEVLLIHPATDGAWVAMGKPGSAMRPGKFIDLGDGVRIETLEVLDDGNRIVRFVGATAEDAIARFGLLPLPPYIERAPTAEDEERYQTVYAKREGSVAAPTAGLHFTPAILRGPRRQGRRDRRPRPRGGPRHVQAGGGRRPSRRHVMHEERYEIPHALTRAVTALRARGGKLWAVGTTVVRALESASDERGIPQPGDVGDRHLHHAGVPVPRGRPPADELPPAALHAAHARLGVRGPRAAHAQPIGTRSRNRYRFYSYGDAMLVL